MPPPTDLAALLTPERLADGLDYATYAAQMDRLVAEGRTSGTEQTPALVDYTRLNQARMRRVYIQTVLNEELRSALAAVTTPQYWLILTEAWCGDAAQNVPALARMAELNPQIELKLLFRDAHLPLMDAFLTNGGRSIPKLLAVRKADHALLGTWGPRPAGVQALMDDFKANPAGRTKGEVLQAIAELYTRNKSQFLQAELLDLVRQWQ